ncbi:MAG: glycosyltransferase family 4 protein [Nitrosomonas sp.]|nr:glycosyltransferase family 4 protein [Nitrosomonas sp.]
MTKSAFRAHALFVTSWLPEPGTWLATAGIARRQQLLVDGLLSTGYKLHVLLMLSPKQYDGTTESARRISEALQGLWGTDIDVTLCAWKAPTVNRSFWRSYLYPVFDFRHQAVLAKYLSPEIISVLKSAITENTAVVLCQRLWCVLPVLKANSVNAKVFFDMDDIEHIRFSREISQPPIWRLKRLLHLQVLLLMCAEYLAIKRSMRTFVCSQLDKERLQRLFRHDSVEVLPNAMPLREAGVPANRPTLLILGHYDFGANRVGADHFIANVWPLVLNAVPSACLSVAGANPHFLEAFSASPEGVHFPGYITDLDQLYTETRIVICPILSGGGTRLKIMEAAAYGRPIVSTSIGAEGIDLEDGEEIIIADTPRAMADACIRLINDYSFALQLSLKAKAAIERRYSRDKIIARLGDLLSGASE